WNNLNFTRDCIDSIVRNTKGVDCRLIIIDNASGEETKNYLEGLKGLTEPKVLLVRNNNNLGFIKAVNQGMRLSEAPYVCLINNDTLAAEGWLSEMITVAEGSPDIGLVNPSSNTLGQRPVKDESVDSYAAALKKESGKWEEIGSAIGFCILIKREVIDKIGVFDEIYGMGNFEDTDYSRRAIKEGYICVRACASYVHHREGASFVRGRKFDENFERNRQIYEFRWGKRRWIAYILEPIDEYTLARFDRDAIRSARTGYWVWSFSKGRLDLPRHSNIIQAVFDKNFYIKTLFKILFKKKKFGEIYVTDQRLEKILERLSFIHKAKVYYY
ncbi:MAG: glycosyltransferase family 2 protein, partial [Candidatus Omnitrophica bacterium]|nr:glycosyltransferase family 2 protein [Candidatus Omnitrophota bacterium]